MSTLVGAAELLGKIACVILVYAYVAYPAVVIAIARLAGPRDRSLHGAVETCSVVLVVRNELHTIGRRLHNLLEQRPAGCVHEIVVVDDGSWDATPDVVRAMGARDPRIRMLSGRRSGKAAGINAGVAAAKCGIVVLCDARQVFERDAIQCLLAGFTGPDVGLVAGNLRLTSERFRRSRRGPGGYYWAVERRLRRAEAQLGLLHGISGAIYAARRELMPVLPDGLILDDVFVPLSIGQAGYTLRYREDAVAWDQPPYDGRTDFLKRRRTLGGNFELLRAHPEYLAFVRSPQLFAFVSHKVLRLLTPVLLAATSLWVLAVGGWWAGLALAVGLGLAVLTVVVPASAAVRGPAGALLRLIQGVTLVNLAILAGIWALVRGRQADLWHAVARRRG